ncbi:peptidase S41 [Spirochaetia bacterium]|nr:peptidase S41 [Spirochaetia bacterium]
MNKPRFSYSLLWVLSTIYLCGLFACASAAPANAQSQTTDAQYIQSIREAFGLIQRRFVDEVSPRDLFEGAMNGMFGVLGDRHSSFLDEHTMSDLSETTEGNFGGVGLYISKPNNPPADGSPAYVEVASPIEDTPGWRANISPGDLIIEVNGTSTALMTMDEVLGVLRGTVGGKVDLLIRRGKSLEFPVTLTRAVIEVPTVKSAMIGSTGYLKLLTFTPRTVDRAKEALDAFKAANYTSLILDLRNNYGGLLNSAVNICDLFLDGGLVVATKSRIPSENITFNAKRGTTVPADMPVIVLINQGSASASEIVAGALKDRGRAYLVGEKSYGKGSVQQVYGLTGSVGFKLTIARYYTPSDVNIDKIGIPPDREVHFPEFTESDSEQLNALIAAKTIPAFVEEHPNAAPADVNALTQRLAAQYHLDPVLIARLIRNEQNRTVIAPAYDLDYDVQLQEAVNILKNGNYPGLMRTTKTLKQLQDEAVEEGMALAS